VTDSEELNANLYNGLDRDRCAIDNAVTLSELRAGRSEQGEFSASDGHSQETKSGGDFG
jgi:hypothetical protein